MVPKIAKIWKINPENLKKNQNVERNHSWKFKKKLLKFEEVRRIFSFIVVTFDTKKSQNFEKKSQKYKTLL